MRVRLLVALLPAVLACPGPTPKPDGGTLLPPTISSISPTTGPIAGGTNVTVNGSRFVDGATVKFGDAPGLQVVVQNALRLTVRTPAVTNAGRVALTVTNPDGTSATLPDAFTFEAGTTRTITQALVTNAAESTDRSGAAMITVAITAQVEVPNVTKGTGQGSGVKGQVGFATTLSATPAESDFTWTDATYSADADGAMAGDAARDVYGAMVTVPGAMMMSKTYRLAARFSVDNGATWKLADRDGSSNGVQEPQLPKLTVEVKGVDWCRLGGQTVGTAPPTVNLRGTQMGPTIYAQVFVMGRTEAGGAGTGIKGQLGYGMMGANPSTWTWVDGAFNTDVGNNDEWRATLPNPGEGSYRFAWRFNLDDGTYAYCDNDGLAMNGFTEDQAGTLVVTAPGVDNCVLQFPNNAQALVGAAGPLVYGRVFAGGITDRLDGGAPPMTLSMELGIGPGGVQPDQSSWSWQAAAFNVPVAGGGAEFQSRLPASLQGTYAYAWRAKLGSGAYAYCDLDGSQNGFQTTQAGVYTVAPFNFDECRLQFPATLTSAEGRPTSLVYGQVFATGVTNVAPDGGAPAGIDAELGVGPSSSDPQQPDAGWSWTAGAFNTGVTGNGAEYQASITGPVPGTYAYAWRVRYMGGVWTYCDLDGSANSYQQAQAGVLTAGPYDVDECFVDTTSQQSTPMTALPGPYLARVRVPTLTQAAGQGLGVTAEIGYGPTGSTPSTWSTWTAATFDADSMAFDRYSGTFTTPNSLGTFDVAFRFRVGTKPFVYCDRDGRGNGYTSAQAAQLQVTSALVSACQLLTPSAFSVESGSPLTASVNVAATGTPTAGQAPNIRAQIGMGVPSPDDASQSALWGWGEATYVNDVNGRDVYELTFQPSYIGARAVAARVSTNNGVSWTYCDLNGSDQNGFEPSQQYNVTVTRHTSVQFCKLQFPATVSIDAGVSRVYGQVFQSGVTPDAGAPIRAQFGIGARNAEPSLAWQWGPAAFLGFGLPPTMNNNNEYFVDYRPDGGNPNYAFRFSRDDGGTWCYADNDGNGANGAGQAWDGFRGDLNGPVNLGQVAP
ncbi:MAG: IPT/TIG domain-containing protein [Archangium sp.]|nr:IPT/TIG domain-containing protein [Archangium sp.]